MYLDFQGPEIVPFPCISLEWQLPQQELVLQQKVRVNRQNLPTKVQRWNNNYCIKAMLYDSMMKDRMLYNIHTVFNSAPF